MLKDLIHQRLEKALREAASNLNNLEIDSSLLESLKIERPKNTEHGDFAVNVSPLARQTKMAPPKIAETVKTGFENGNMHATTIGGFLNLKLDDELLAEALVKLATAKKGEVAKNTSMKDLAILLEYVSANPTGPLHIGHGRWAALGDSLIRIFRHCGALAVPEFYINDAGVQMNNISDSLFIRCVDNLFTSKQLPNSELKEKNTIEPTYPGEYVKELATTYLNIAGNKEKIVQDWNSLIADFEAHSATDFGLFLSSYKFQHRLDYRNFCKDKMLVEQQQLLDTLGVVFENWFSEYDYLHMDDENGANRVTEAFNALKNVGFLYEQDGAWFFKTTAYGDEKDRVVKKQDGTYTYLMPDIAYHKHKFEREDLGHDGYDQFNRVINIWGADHHGYIPRMRAALNALGFIKDEFQTKTDKEGNEKIELVKTDPKFEVVLGQLVNLIVDGEKTRMGKRRKMLTLQDVVDEVGVDATRFFMMWKPAETALDFDVDLALKQTSDNPVFYVQYAHARCASILRNAASEQTNNDTGEKVPALFTADELAKLETGLTADQLKPLFEKLDDDKAKEALKTLILKLDGFEDMVKDAASHRAPHLLARYAHEVAGDYHAFYNVCRILTPDKALTQSRLAVILALKKVLAQALELLGVSAPEQM